MAIVILCVDPGSMNMGLGELNLGGVVLKSTFLSGKTGDTFTGFCDELDRCQRKYGRHNVIVAIEDAEGRGEGRRGVFKLVGMVNGIHRWSEAKGCRVVKLRRVDVLRAFGLKGKVSKARAKVMIERVLRCVFETEHEADAAAVGWVVARKVTVEGRLGKASVRA